MWQYEDKHGNRKENRHRPRVAVKHIDSKRALKGFTSSLDPDEIDLIPEGAQPGSDAKQWFRGNFLDLRTLAFVLTDRGHSLESACQAFGVEHGKTKAERHGIVTTEYIDYNRRDVLATAELCAKLLEEYDRFDVRLQVTKAYSPASLGKAHLRAMGIAPILERQPDFPKQYLGYAQAAFYGGRTSAHIRKTPVPVVYVDFLSMYPTVNSLMGLWSFVIAERIDVQANCVREIEKLLRTVTLEKMFDPQTWRKLPAFVRIIPNGDVLPTRAKYSHESNDWQVAINHLFGANHDPKDGLWFALPDVVASVLLTGPIPKIVDAFRIVPKGTMPGLKAIRLRGAVEINPQSQDFFRAVIEERKRHGSADPRLDKAFKVLGSATSYGIFAEMRRQESIEQCGVTCYGIDADPFRCRVPHVETPGEYCFPQLASLITSGARLMLAMLERCVTDLGGTYAMEDTDSMAIVATKRGGLVECPGGPYRKNGIDAVKALSWEHVTEIVKRFAPLNPYDRDAVWGSILKIEADNFDPKTGRQRQLWCLAISAKRYALFLRNRDGDPILLRKGENNGEDRWSEHGLGHLLNPTNPRSDDRSWIAQVWLRMIRRSLGLTTKSLPFQKRPAVGRITISSPAVLKPLRGLNAGKTYPEQIKPSNFILSCHVRALGHPIGVDPERFHLIAPYELDPRQWAKVQWVDQYFGKRYRISASAPHGSRSLARVKNYGDILRGYEFHPESKCDDKRGEACNKRSVGLLARRHVTIASITYIGKESNRLEEVEEQSLTDPSAAYTEYPDPRRDGWYTKVLPIIKAVPLPRLQELAGLSRRALQMIRAGRRPHAKNMVILRRIARAKSSYLVRRGAADQRGDSRSRPQAATARSFGWRHERRVAYPW